MVLSTTISWMLAGGLAGVTYYLGYMGSIQPKVLISTGFDAIAVSLLGSNNPFGIVSSTMLITLIGKGNTYMKSAAGVDAKLLPLSRKLPAFSAHAMFILNGRWSISV